MKLMHGKVSPFVRKVMIAAHEKGLADSIEIVPTAVGQGKVNDDLMKLNPIGKIPTLVVSEDFSIFDSMVICEYFDFLKSEKRLIPVDPMQRIRVLTINAVADGLLVALTLAKVEASRAPEKQWAEFHAAQTAKVMACLASLADAELGGEGPISISEIATISALGMLDFRAPEIDWRSRHKALAAWMDRQADRASVLATTPN
ncbi:glutathione S-transferase family protein [Devosia sp. A449]